MLDLGALLDAVVFNLVIGNNDAHGKNFALLHAGNGSTRLAPLYDLVCTACYPTLAGEMAMRVGGQRVASGVSSTDLEGLAKEAELAVPLVKRRALELVEVVLARIDDVARPSSVSDRVAMLIRERAETLARRFRE